VATNSTIRLSGDAKHYQIYLCHEPAVPDTLPFRPEESKPACKQAVLLARRQLSRRSARKKGKNPRGVKEFLRSPFQTCKHLEIDPFAYLRDALPGLFALGEAPKAEQLLDWLPDRWLLIRTRDNPIRDLTAG
jgi:hypothetical protein